jgi:tryptophan-rich sensory protein
MKKKILLISIATPLIMGGLIGLISRNETFSSLVKPPLSPPGWIFPVVWTVLYTLMGIAAFLILTSDAPPQSIRDAMTFYGFQLFFNLLWPILFFNLRLYFAAFVCLVVLWGLIGITIGKFRPISRTAARLMVPYFLWVTFAGYLNLAIALLN